jgi:type IV pilus assembly protein PilM
MGLFSSNKNFLGIDIGSTSIKIVELAKHKSKPKLVSYGFADQLSNLLADNSPQAQMKASGLIEKILAQSKIGTRRAVTALPNFYVFSSVINVPVTTRKSLQDTIRWEAKKIVPMNLDEVILDWKILNEADLAIIKNDEKKRKAGQRKITRGEEIAKTVEVLITAAPRNLVQKYINIFKLAAVNLSSLETESFALARSLLSDYSESVMILDIGSLASDIMIIEQGIPVITRSIDVGGKSVTQAIERSLKVDFKRAEQLKQDIGIMEQYYAEGISRVIAGTFSSVVNEINYTIDLYKNRGKKIARIILSGGSSYLAGLPQYFQNTLKIDAHVGDPWHKVSYAPDLQPVIEEIGPRFAVAIGLALRDIDI